MTQTAFYPDTIWNPWLAFNSPLASNVSNTSILVDADINATATTSSTTTTTTTTTTCKATKEIAPALDQQTALTTDEYLAILAVDPTLFGYLPITPSPDFPPLVSTVFMPPSDPGFRLPTPASSPLCTPKVSETTPASSSTCTPKVSENAPASSSTCTPKVSETTPSPFDDLASEIKHAKRKYKVLDDHELKICLYPCPPPPPRLNNKRVQCCPVSEWVIKTPDDAEELLADVAISGTTLKKLRAEEKRTGKQLVPRKPLVPRKKARIA